MEYKIQITRTSSSDTNSSILIIYTGGTIGMVKNENDAFVPFNFSHALEKIPELNELDLQITVVSFPELIDSSNINIKDWQSLGAIIFENHEHYDGFVILHGTDTMAYTASALSYMFEGLDKPIVLTGAQIPIGQLRSDARDNLITSLQIASAKKEGVSVIQEVVIYFDFFLIRGNRSQKVRSSTFSAFESQNYPHLASSGIFIEYHEANFLQLSDKRNEKVIFRDGFDPNVIVLKIFPGITSQVIGHMLSLDSLKGIVLESYGSGNAMTDGWFIELLSDCIKRGVIVYNVSQCSGGEVIPGRYDSSKRLMDVGVISGGDITTEAALTKLMFLLANESDASKIKAMLEFPLRGEMDG